MATAVDRQRPSWLNTPGLSLSLLSAPAYLQRTDGGQAQQPLDWAKHLDDEVLREMATGGAQLLVAPWFCGYGIHYEKTSSEQVRDLASRAKAHGLYVAASISLGSLTPATLLIEEPDASNWIQVNQIGLPPSAPGDQEGSRVRPCYNSEGYLRYLEKICDAVLESDCAALIFDDLGFNAEPDSCHCAVCVASFREMLREKYGPHDEKARQAGQERFGFNNFSHVRPPVFNSAAQAERSHLLSPLLQEWTLFKVRSLSDALKRLTRFVERKNAAISVGACLPKIFAANNAWQNGFCLEALFPCLDLVIDTFKKPSNCGHHGSEDRTYKWRGPARVYRLAASFQTKAFIARGARDRDLDLACAQALCFQPEILGVATTGCQAENPTLQGYRSLARRLGENTGTRLAHVAVLRDTNSLSFEGSTQRATLGVEQILLEENIPYENLFQPTPEELADYPLVIAANIALMSDVLAKTLCVYVEHGGGLVVVESPGGRDTWGRKRQRPALATIFGPDFPAPGTQTEVAFGKGRVAYIAKLHWDHSAQCSAADKGLKPTNSEAVLNALAFAEGTKKLPWQVQASGGKPLLQGSRNTDRILQLRMMNLHQTEELSGICIQLPLENAPEKVVFISGDTRQELPINYNTSERLLEVRLEKAPLFSVIEIG